MDYKDTNSVRYEAIKYYDVENNIYAAINPVGNYSYYIAYKSVRWFLRELHKHSRIPYHNMKVLDVGCGDGHISRMMVSLLDNADNICAFDYSNNNVEQCQRLNPAVDYKTGDIVEGIPYDMKFDGITAFVVLSHLRKEIDVIQALKNIYDSLSDDGLFLWYELVSKSHYINPDKDTQGFNYREMTQYAKEAGFEEVARKSFSRTVWVGKKSRSLYYSANEHNIWLLELISKILPLRPTITIRIYKKEK